MWRYACRPPSPPSITRHMRWPPQALHLRRVVCSTWRGSGAALWACAVVWPSLANARIIEHATGMIAAGQALAANANQPAVRSAVWQRGDLLAQREFTADLISLAYVLGELDAGERAQLVAQLAASGKSLLIVEPGTPAGFAIMRAVRAQLIAAGMQIAAPCPHQNACPMPADDWCHMAQRIARIPIQRRVKGAELGYEDEKCSYVAAVQAAPAPIAGRVIRRPEARSGLITLHLCTPDGLCREQISRRDPRWRQARDLGWGDALE
ncbi:MAG: rRNA methyltransferase [Oscillochloris sp.]|nr:rRNA methyltransferase [Oscillochloris sp.]